MSKIRDTSRFFGSAEADMILVDAHTQRRPGQVSSAFIEGMEREGQAQLVTSDPLSTKCGDHAPWLALGFTFGDPDSSDPAVHARYPASRLGAQGHRSLDGLRHRGYARPGACQHLLQGRVLRPDSEHAPDQPVLVRHQGRRVRRARDHLR